MVRKARVELEADVAKFIPGMEGAAKATANVDDKVDAVDRSLKKLPPDAVKAAAAMKLLGAEAGTAKLKLEDIGKSSTSLGALDQRLMAARFEVRRLAEEFNKTGDASVLGRLFKADTDVKGLERLRKRLTSALTSGMADAATQAPGLFAVMGTSSAKSFFQAFGALPPQAQAAIAGGIATAIAASASLIGAALNGALLAGVATGGLALGIVGQVNNPQIRAAAGVLANDLKLSLSEATSVLGPTLLAGIHRLDTALSAAITKLGPAFAHLQPVLDRLIRGVVGLIENMGPGFARAIEAGGKVLERIADELPRLGATFGQFFDMISDGAGGASDAVVFLLRVFEATLLTVGFVLKTLSDNFQQLELVVALATGNMGEAARIITDMRSGAQETGPAVDELGTSIGGMGVAAQTASQRMAGLNDEIQRAFNVHMAADRAALAYKDSIEALNQSIKDNGRNWDENTTAGRRNWQALQDAIEKAEAKREADVAAGKDALAAAGQFNEQADAAFAIAGGAGAAKDKLDKMKGDYKIKITQEIVNIVTNVRRYDKVENTLDRFERRAAGGPVLPGRPYWVGEQGVPELFVPQTSGRIVPAADVPRQVDYGSMRPGGGGGTTKLDLSLRVDAGSGGPEGRLLEQLLNNAINSGRVSLWAGGQRVRTNPA